MGIVSSSEARRLRRYGRRFGPRGVPALEIEVNSFSEFTAALTAMTALHEAHCSRCAYAHVCAAFADDLSLGLITYQAVSVSERLEAARCFSDVHARFCSCEGGG